MQFGIEAKSLRFDDFSLGGSVTSVAEAVLCMPCMQGEYGDVTARKELRKRLKCKSFDWYLTNIFPELFIPGDAVASGEVSLYFELYFTLGL